MAPCRIHFVREHLSINASGLSYAIGTYWKLTINVIGKKYDKLHST